jgi:anti-sigma factor ChrR (cupin superfamily)
VNDMQINADFDQRVVRPPPHPQDWVQSPMTGVHRYLLDRVGGEIARATSLVRYAATCARCGQTRAPPTGIRGWFQG